MRHFINVDGLYLGDLKEAPAGAIEIDAAPTISTQVWNGSAWVAGPPAPPPPPSPRQWLERLTSAKQAAISTAALGNAAILLWVLKASGSPIIDVTAQETKDGITALVAAGVLTADDQALLLAP